MKTKYLIVTLIFVCFALVVTKAAVIGTLDWGQVAAGATLSDKTFTITLPENSDPYDYKWKSDTKPENLEISGGATFTTTTAVFSIKGTALSSPGSHTQIITILYRSYIFLGNGQWEQNSSWDTEGDLEIKYSVGDSQAPTDPTNLHTTAINSNSISLAWTASTDNGGVTGYNVYKDGNLYDDFTGTSCTLSGLTACTRYSFKVTAYDAEGNESGYSNVINPTTISALTITYNTDKSSIKPFYPKAQNIIYFKTGFKYSATTSSHLMRTILGGCDALKSGDNNDESDNYVETLDLPEINDQKEISLFPNPTTGLINVHLAGEYTYSIISTNGMVITKDVKANGATSVDLAGQANGIYFLIIQTSTGENYQKKIVKL
jgi:hypothetical protein